MCVCMVVVGGSGAVGHCVCLWGVGWGGFFFQHETHETLFPNAAKAPWGEPELSHPHSERFET